VYIWQELFKLRGLGFSVLENKTYFKHFQVDLEEYVFFTTPAQVYLLCTARPLSN
jgi:hypothetical protein